MGTPIYLGSYHDARPSVAEAERVTDVGAAPQFVRDSAGVWRRPDGVAVHPYVLEQTIRRWKQMGSKLRVRVKAG